MPLGGGCYSAPQVEDWSHFWALCLRKPQESWKKKKEGKEEKRDPEDNTKVEREKYEILGGWSAFILFFLRREKVRYGTEA